MADLEAKAWSKDQLIWQIIGTSRWDLREKEAMKKFSNFIFYENDVGNISRQELVSMVPVLLLVTTVSIWIVNTVTIQKPDFRIPDSCKNWTSEYRIHPKSRFFVPSLWMVKFTWLVWLFQNWTPPTVIAVQNPDILSEIWIPKNYLFCIHMNTVFRC